MTARDRADHTPALTTGTAGQVPFADMIEDRGERMLRVVLLLTLALVAVTIAVGFTVGVYDPTRMFPRLAIAAVCVLSLLVLRRWGVRAAVRIFLCAALGVCVLQGFMSSGIRTPSVAASPAVLMLAGWFLGRRETFLLGTLAFLSVTAMAVLEYLGLFVPMPREVLDYWLLLLIVIPVASMIGVHAHARFLDQLRVATDGVRRFEAELAARQRSEDRMRATLENTPNVAIQWYDETGRVLYWNQASEALFGWPALEAVGVRMGGLFLSAAEADEVIATMRTLDPGGLCDGPREYGVRCRDGSRRWVSSTMFAIPGDSGRPTYVCMDIDISERKRTEAELKARNESLRLLSELSSRVYAVSDVESILRIAIDVVRVVTRAPGVLTYLCEPGGRYLHLVAQQGFDEDYEWIAERVDLLHSWTGLSLKSRKPQVAYDIRRESQFDPLIREALLARGLGSGVVIPLLDSDEPLGCITLFYPSDALSASGRGEMETYEAVSRTLSMAIANVRRLDQLRHQARHDTLTGLPNRAALHDEFARLNLDAGARPSMMLLDLDRFKEVNDTLGHHIGDQLLGALSQRLTDTVGTDGAITCRLGGDEFAVLLHDAGGSDEALARARAIRQALVRPFDVDGMSLKVGASVGVAMYPEHGTDSHGLLRAADVAMYRAKGHALGVVLYDRDADVHSPQRLALLAELADAITHGELVMHYQPKLDLHTGDICGFEALVRWRHPKLGLLFPGSFMPLAEASEVIHQFTRAVMDLAMADCARLRAIGLTQPVALNLSARNLVDDRCVNDIEDLIAAHGLDYRDIELEITETTIMHDPAQVADLLDRLDRRGVGLAIDDFGTGYSSLAHLKRLPMDFLKVDRTFVRDMIVDDQDAAIVRSTITLAHSLDMKVIAEGVEDRATLDMLRGMGCDMIQGYHLSKPLPLEDLLVWVERRAAGAALAVC